MKPHKLNKFQSWPKKPMIHTISWLYQRRSRKKYVAVSHRFTSTHDSHSVILCLFDLSHNHFESMTYIYPLICHLRQWDGHQRDALFFWHSCEASYLACCLFVHICMRACTAFTKPNNHYSYKTKYHNVHDCL